ncbi:unnamed protein product [Taenia asiatica]|uniref:B box-type domain-containing protein n=1 Tax=Taenia asiatica TaxID=60517 RepID=A0A0R3W2M5_TAEAS|nr:unnamed protein product [Taenia asiatica]
MAKAVAIKVGFVVWHPHRHHSYDGGSRISTNSPQREQMSQQHSVRNGGVGGEETINDRNGIRRTVCCSNCQRQISPQETSSCQHCQRQVCTRCLVKHRDSVSIVDLHVVLEATYFVNCAASTITQTNERSYIMMMRVNLDILACYKANLRARPMKDTKERIADALKEPVSEMCAAAYKALDAATEKVKKEDLASSGTINGLVSRITKLSTKFVEVRNVYNLSERLEDLQMAVATWKWLRSLLTNVEELRTAMKQVSPLPITQMRLSDQFNEVSRQTLLCASL